MNLNKYDGQGYPYTAEEAAERAYAFFGQRFVAPGCKRGIDEKTGLPRIEKTLKPYNVGSNAAKREARAAHGARK